MSSKEDVYTPKYTLVVVLCINCAVGLRNYQSFVLFAHVAFDSRKSSGETLDVIRISQQLGLPDIGDGSLPDTAKGVWRHNGLFGFWKGNMTYSLHNLPFIVVQFYLQDFLQRFLSRTGVPLFAARYVSNFFASAAGVIAAYPLEIARLRLIQQRLSNVQYYGTLDALVKISKREGPTALFTSLSNAVCISHVIRWSSHALVSLCTGTILNMTSWSVLHSPQIHRLCSSLLAAAIWFPFDATLKITQASSLVLDEYMRPEYVCTDYIETFKRMWHSGVKRLYRGFPAYIAKTTMTGIISSISIYLCQKYWLWINGYTQGPLDATPIQGVPQHLTPAQLRHHEWEQQRLPLYRYASHLHEPRADE